MKQYLLDTFGHLGDVKLIALTIYGEARGEKRKGKIAVGTVILNRVVHRKWDGETVRDVCLMPYQFSCFSPNDPNGKELARIAANWKACALSPDLKECIEIAERLLEGTIRRPRKLVKNHVTQYLRFDCSAPWRNKMDKVCRIGAHEFYAERG